MTSRLFIRVLISVICLTFANCTPKKDYTLQTEKGAVWGTTYTIKYDSPTSRAGVIVQAMAEIDSTFSTFNPTSELSRLNRGEAIKPGAAFLEVFELSKRIHALSGGAFDPTVMTLVNLWGFGPDDTRTEPSQQQIDSALSVVGLDRCLIAPDGTYSGAPLDFAAIAKGYGVDLVARALSQAGVENYMVEIGGEVAARGLNPQGKPWRIQIDAPQEGMAPDEHPRLCIVELDNCAMATSGNYRNRRIMPDGTPAWHTISPSTGRPVRTNMLSATVIAADCATADALATAAMALPPAEAEAMLRSLRGIRAVLVTTDQTIKIGL